MLVETCDAQNQRRQGVALLLLCYMYCFNQATRGLTSPKHEFDCMAGSNSMHHTLYKQHFFLSVHVSISIVTPALAFSHHVMYGALEARWPVALVALKQVRSLFIM